MNPASPNEEAKVRAELAAAYCSLAELGMNDGSSGNISCRFDGGILISPTGADRTLTPDRLVSLALDGTVRGDGVPSSEWLMHTSIYLAYPAAAAVVHTHADACVALSCEGLPIPPFHYQLAAFGGHDVPCAPYATFGTRALSDAAIAALKDRSACLLANHGMICHGISLAKAVSKASRLETLARQYLMAKATGKVNLLEIDEMHRVRERFAAYGTGRLST